MRLKSGIRFSSAQIIAGGFIALILFGTGLLMLPFASAGGESASLFDALFTSVSAVCVTGLVVRDTATCWSGFGQAVILALIQIGGMGVVTIAVFFVKITGRKIGLVERSLMQETLSAPQVGGIIRLTGFIIRTSLIIEAIGALLLACVFSRELGLWRGIWYGVFHSVSAFCNAGFDLMGFRERFSSLTYYASDPVVNTVIPVLITVGGIGFITWDDIRENFTHPGKLRLQTKLILIAGAVLLFFPALMFFFTDFRELQLGERIMKSLFQSATARTAGFNTADLGKMSEGGIAVMILLMLTGGAPGSTAGGMKTTTVAVLILASLAVFRRNDTVDGLGRRVPDSAVRHAVAILLLYLVLFLAGGIIISSVDKLPLLTALFETASAIGTVGLTLGITPALSVISKIILMFLMFFGRVGGLTLIYSFSTPKPVAGYMPQERVTVG